LKIFQTADLHTIMSLSDVINHLCLVFKEGSQDFAQRVTPKLIETLGTMKEEDVQSIISLIGMAFLSVKYN
jgi:predicted CopG family antitoxin